MTEGNCFEKAVEICVLMGEDAKVAHGLPVGQGVFNLNKRYWHAWVEVTTSSGFVVCVDQSNDNDIAIPRAMYYRIGYLNEAHVWRFTADEAYEEMRTRGHFGPWVDNWEERSKI